MLERSTKVGEVLSLGFHQRFELSDPDGCALVGGGVLRWGVGGWPGLWPKVSEGGGQRMRQTLAASFAAPSNLSALRARRMALSEVPQRRTMSPGVRVSVNRRAA